MIRTRSKDFFRHLNIIRDNSSLSKDPNLVQISELFSPLREIFYDSSVSVGVTTEEKNYPVGPDIASFGLVRFQVEYGIAWDQIDGCFLVLQLGQVQEVVWIDVGRLRE
jgi:hypothetical protein